jgi:transglutaminase-like putative cysteine protease
LWLSGRIVLLAMPLAALLFVVFPRLQGPLWGMPEDATTGRTGLSGSMAPGNMARLAQSEEPAFRVRFIDPAPAPQLLYWRGVVLADFDGRRWSQGPAGGLASPRTHSWQGAAIRHEITLEPSGQRWLFALDLADSAPAVSGNASALSLAHELSATGTIDQRIRYTVVSHPRYQLQAEGELADAARWLRLPDGSNPRTMAAGIALRLLDDPAERINTVLQMFRREQFVYTLEPPVLGRESVDEFLYRTRSGFCEHYASAFVFLMRAAGVPARVVTGYQGGEINPVDGFMTVRQSDAHAWAEVWLEGRGWQRVDPTAAVAPSRVMNGAARPARRANPFGIAALDRFINLGAGDDSLLGTLRFRMAALNNGWNQWVLNYSPERQRGAVAALSASISDPRIWGALALAVGLIAVLHRRRVRRQGDPVDALYSALCNQLARHGVPRAGAEGPLDFGRRIAASPLGPVRINAATRFLRLYTAYKYGAPPAPPGLLVTLKNLLKQLR